MMTTPSEQNRLPAAMRGGLWMVAGAASFTVMTALIREAATQIHPFEIAFFRAVTNLVLMLPFALRTGRTGLRSKNHKVFALRGACGLVFLLTYFPGAALIPVDQSQALIFTAPLWATLLAVIFLGEQVKRSRAVALTLGFAGALIIVRPGAVELSLGAILVLTAALANAAGNTILKYTTRTNHPDAIVLYLMIYVTPLIFLPSFWVWIWPSFEQLLLLLGVGFFATLNQRFVSRAFAAADATAVLPFDFARLPFAAAVGFLVFSDLPDIWTWLGGAVIFSASIYMARRERAPAR